MNPNERQRSSAGDASAPHIHDVVVVGAGFTGLGLAYRLREAGVRDFVLLERADDVGGTWRDNTYPGAACDVPSNLYSYSFAPNPEWSRSFAGGPEILAYLRDFARREALLSCVRFGHDVVEARFGDHTWHVTTRAHGVFRARALLLASGPLANASWPDIAGIGDFAGKKIHSARWDHGYDFEGKRVAVIGTGASAVQLVPELAKRARALKVFQRTAPWIVPRGDYATPDWQRALFRAAPITQRAVRVGTFYGAEALALGVVWTSPLTTALEMLSRAHLRRAVADRWLRRQLTPDYRLGCKRMLITNDYYPALVRPNVKLITWPIVRLRREGIQTAEGVVHAFDCVVFATGFEVAKNGFAFPVHGAAGRELGEAWSRGAHAYKSVSVPGFPNLFITAGPNSGPGHNSYLAYMEAQIGYIVHAVSTMLREGIVRMEVREGHERAYNVALQARLARTSWSAGCRSWYLSEDGYNATMYPGFATQYVRQMQRFDVEGYDVVVRGDRVRMPAPHRVVARDDHT